jgi:cob(I)alamin adenosyltransferase
MLYCYTGNGKGKTTAALGLALRAAGYGMKVGILQFMKGTWHTGELDSIAKISEIDLIQMGKGFYKILDDHWTEEEHKKAAEEGLPYQTLVASVLHKFVSGRLA